MIERKPVAIFFIILILLNTFIPFGSAAFLRIANHPEYEIIENSHDFKVIENLVKSIIGENIYQERNPFKVKQFVVDNMDHIEKYPSLYKYVKSILYETDLEKIFESFQNLISGQEFQNNFNRVQRIINSKPLSSKPPSENDHNAVRFITAFFLAVVCSGTLFWNFSITHSMVRNRLHPVFRYLVHLLFMMVHVSIGFSISVLLLESANFNTEVIVFSLVSGVGLFPIFMDILLTTSPGRNRVDDESGRIIPSLPGRGRFEFNDTNIEFVEFEFNT